MRTTTTGTPVAAIACQCGSQQQGGGETEGYLHDRCVDKGLSPPILDGDLAAHLDERLLLPGEGEDLTIVAFTLEAPAVLGAHGAEADGEDNDVGGLRSGDGSCKARRLLAPRVHTASRVDAAGRVRDVKAGRSAARRQRLQQRVVQDERVAALIVGEQRKGGVCVGPDDGHALK